MSANSPRHVMRCVPTVVPPQAVSDRSIYDSVAGFIDVALANAPQGDPKDAILWVKFENSADISDLCFGDDWDLEGRAPPPLLLILGYVTGIQVWAIPANGEAFEVLSWRHGSVKALRILPTPQSCDFELADEPLDQYTHKRPLMAICDNSGSSSSSGGGGGGGGLSMPQQQYCSVNFLSLKTKEQVKTIKFKNQVIEILANRTSVVITFPEKIAVFDARTLDDRLTITACHPSPGLNPNPVALGPRWMAYAERRLIPSKRSSGGCDYDGVSSYTATVLNAAKSLGKGLRELGESVAAGFAGNAGGHGSGHYSNAMMAGGSQTTGEKRQPGVITILDIKYPITDSSPVSGAPVSSSGEDRIIAHFVAHSDAVVALSFDFSGMLLISADKRGHDFHVFRVHAHPGGPSMSAVHHLYVLHRGDTSSKVQDVCFSLDSRWASVSTLRGTTHVFPITPYGGPAGVRTHGSSHVVNRLSRFHRSAGLSIDSRSSSPISHSDFPFTQSTSAYPNPRTPPFPHPTVVVPLAQLRQPVNAGPGNPSGASNFAKSGPGRQRVQSLSEDSANPLRVCATFARPRAYLLDVGGTTPRDTNAAKQMHNKSNDSLFVMTAYGTLIQYDLDPRPLSNVPKEKVCDDTPIELEVEAKAQWNLMRNDDSIEIQPPLPADNILLKERLNDGLRYSDDHVERGLDERGDDLWLSQVEIITHAGPHRRLWMGPQFMFKTYNTPSGASLSTIEVESVEIGVGSPGNRGARSNPVNMPPTAAGRSGVSVLIESSSYSSIEQSPRMTQLYYEQPESNFTVGTGDNQLREDLADAMRETSAGVPLLDAGSVKSSTSMTGSSSSSSTGTAPRINPSLPTSSNVSIAKVVNPLGTVTTVLKTERERNDDDPIDDDCSGDFISDRYVHENCDEALFRPVVTVISDKKNQKECVTVKYDRPAPMGLDLIVPVIEEKPNLGGGGTGTASSKKKKEIREKEVLRKREEIQKFDELSAQNKKKDKKKSTAIPTPAVTETIIETKSTSVKDKSVEKDKIIVVETTQKEKFVERSKEKDKEIPVQVEKIKDPSPPPVTVIQKKKALKVVEEPETTVSLTLPKPKKRSSKSVVVLEEKTIEKPVKLPSPPPQPTQHIQSKKSSTPSPPPPPPSEDEIFPPPPPAIQEIPTNSKLSSLPVKKSSSVGVGGDKKKVEKFSPPQIIMDDFPELCQVQDHFSIQESLTKNSDFIIKTSKMAPNEFVVEPLVTATTTHQDYADDDDEHLDFNVMKMVESITSLGGGPTTSSSSTSVKDPEQYFDTRSCSKYDLDFPEGIFSEPLAPLEPFVGAFEELTFKDSPELMNFESPQSTEDKKCVKIVDNDNDDDDCIINLDIPIVVRCDDDNNDHDILIGGNDDDDDDDDDDEKQNTETDITTIEKSSLTNSSSETDDSYNEMKKDDRKVTDDDEELQPLIDGGATSTTTSSETTPNIQTSKAIVDAASTPLTTTSLPTNAIVTENQKETSKQQNNNNNNNNNNKKKSRKKKR